MKNYCLRVISILLFVVFLSLGIANIVLKNWEYNALFQLLEIVSSVFGGITLTLSLTIVKTNINKANKVIYVKSGDYIDKSTYKDVQSFQNNINQMINYSKENNVNNIISKTYYLMQNENRNVRIDKKFLLDYLRESVYISDSDIQDIWAKLLIHESKFSGCISKRTLHIVKNMSSKEAKIFEKIAKTSLNDGNIPDYFASKFSFDDLSMLADIGLLKANPYTEESFELDPQGSELINGPAKDFIKLTNVSGSNLLKFSYDCKILTNEGKELRNALMIYMNKSMFYDFYIYLSEKEKNNKNLQIEYIENINNKII